MNGLKRITAVLVILSVLSVSAYAKGVENHPTITSQIKLNGVTVNEKGLRIIDNASMVCSLNVSDASGEASRVTALLATYNSAGRLHHVKAFEIEVPGGKTESVEISYRFDAENEHTGKLMFWDSLLTLMPIRAAIDFSQTGGINAYYYDSDNRLLQIDKVNGTSVLYTYDNAGSLLTRSIRE